MKKIWKIIVDFFKRLFGKKQEEEVEIENPSITPIEVEEKPIVEESGTTESSTTVVESGDEEFECPQFEIIPSEEDNISGKITFEVKIKE